MTISEADKGAANGLSVRRIDGIGRAFVDSGLVV